MALGLPIPPAIHRATRPPTTAQWPPGRVPFRLRSSATPIRSPIMAITQARLHELLQAAEQFERLFTATVDQIGALRRQAHSAARAGNPQAWEIAFQTVWQGLLAVNHTHASVLIARERATYNLTHKANEFNKERKARQRRERGAPIQRPAAGAWPAPTRSDLPRLFEDFSSELDQLLPDEASQLELFALSPEVQAEIEARAKAEALRAGPTGPVLRTPAELDQAARATSGSGGPEAHRRTIQEALGADEATGAGDEMGENVM